VYNEKDCYQIHNSGNSSLFGLELLMAGWLDLAAKPVLAQIECREKIVPTITVTPVEGRVRYDFNRTKRQLNSINVDTVSPYGPQHNTTVSGLMSGSIQVKHKVSFMQERYPQLGQACLYLRSMEVEVKVDPTIYVAREFPKGSCMHTAVLAHERKHVLEDQLIVSKYAPIFKRDLTRAMDSYGPAFGPFEDRRMPYVQQNIQRSLSKVIQRINDNMNEERRRRQQAIDTFDEYEEIGRRCRE
jgi:hypothetical protein